MLAGQYTRDSRAHHRIAQVLTVDKTAEENTLFLEKRAAAPFEAAARNRQLLLVLVSPPLDLETQRIDDFHGNVVIPRWQALLLCIRLRGT